METERTDQTETTEQPQKTTSTQQRLVDIPIIDEVTALNMLVSFLTLAQRRGSFTMEESAKIWECVKIFQKP